MNLILKIDGVDVPVDWEDNASVAALVALARSAPLEIATTLYGGFEQVGSLGRSLPRHDVPTQTKPGDVMLYSGNQIVLFFGNNSWSYTRLGVIRDKSRQKLRELLGKNAVAVTLSVAEEDDQD